MPQLRNQQKPANFIQSFSAHPKSVGETYGQHLMFATGLGSQLIFAGLAAIVHGLVPGWFQTTASDKIRTLSTHTGARREMAHGGHGENEDATTLAR